MIRLLAATIALFLPTPSLAQDARPYDEAVEARLAGNPARTVDLLESWLDAHPEDVDARVQLAYAQLALDRFDEAEANFNKVLARAPEYADARNGLTLIAERREAGKGTRGHLYAESAISDVSNQARDWTEFTLGGGLPVSETATIDFRGSHFRRFGVGDTELAAGATIKTSTDFWLRFGASIAPSADFRPGWAAGAGFDYRLNGGTNATVIGLDLRYRDYPAQRVFSVEPQVVQYLAEGSFSLTVRGIATLPEGNGLRLGGLLRGDFIPRERLRFYLGIAAGPESELGVVTDTSSLFGGAEFPLNARLSLFTGAAREWREGGIDRTEGRLGLKIGL